MIIEQGSAGTLSAVITDYIGDAVDFDVSPAPTVTVQTLLGVAQTGFPATLTHDGLGLYHYDWSVPLAQTIATYDVNWLGYVGGSAYSGWDTVEVVAAGSIPTTPPATAIGAYASLTSAKARLGIPDTADDSLIQSLCDQANQYIETFTGRVLAPVPVLSTTLASPAGAGATSVIVSSATNAAPGMRIVLGTLGGSVEAANIAASYASGTTLPLSAPEGLGAAWGGLGASYGSGLGVNTAYLFDGMSVLEGGRLLPLPRGFASITQLRLGFLTGDSLKVIPPYDWFTRPVPMEREPGWPITELWMTDIPTTDVQVPLMQQNLATRTGFFANIELVGVPGWPAIPSDIVNIALSLVVGLYRARGAGGGDSYTMGMDGSRTFERLLSYTDRLTLMRYRVKNLWAV